MSSRGKSEARVKQEIFLYLSERGIFAWNNATGRAKSEDGARIISFGLPGSSDILGSLPPNGRFLAIEVKREYGGVQSEKQKIFQAAIERCGGIYILARSVEDVKKHLSFG